MKKNSLLLFFVVIVLVSCKNEAIESVSYSLAKTHNNQFFVEHRGDFKEPQYVDKLPARKQIRGRITSADEIPSAADYYDGSIHMKTEVTVCSQWTTQKEACQSQGNCGWCGASNTCIPGNTNGPSIPCLRGTWEFADPKQNWNPYDSDKVVVTRRNVGGQQLTKMVPV